jgi:glycosyltransferase involved in cell wall biosynthesis
MLLSVGRFFVGGHAKRQDILIDAFADLLNGGVKDVEFHLAGSSQPWGENLDYLASLRERAKDLPVVFHVNCSHGELADLYRRSGFYWHAAGFGVDIAQHPEQAEHFGLSLVEAMSAGALPLAYEAGGPKEIISAGVNGFFFTDARDLVAKTARLLDGADAARLAQMRAAACERAKAFDESNFRERLRVLFRA